MGHIERSIELSAPADRVFDILVDLDRLPHWGTIVVRTDGIPEHPLEVGDTFTQVIRIAGKELDTDWQVVELAQPRHVLYDATGPAGGHLWMRQSVSATPEGSHVTFEIDYQLPGGFLGEAMDRILVERQNEEEAERSLQNLKRLVESESE
jgi:uncharacterized membrane protein